MIRDKDFYRTIFKISLPSAFQSLISFLVVIADNIMVSSLKDGLHAQAAVSQVNSITAFYTATILGLAGGSSVLISQYWGRSDMKSIKKIFSTVMGICVLTSIVFVSIALTFPGFVVGIVIGADETEVIKLARLYFSIVCFSYIPYAISNTLVSMLRSIEVVKITMYITIIAMLTNISLNYVLIYGKSGFPAMGVAGAALATLISRIIEMIIVWIYTFHVQNRLEIKPSDLLHTEKWVVKDYLRYGMPVGITDSQWALIAMLKAAIIGQLGAAFMASSSIANTMAQLGSIFTFSLAGGACVVVGKAVGKGDYDRARKYSKTIQVLFFLIGLFMSGAMYFTRKPFISLYGSASNPEVYNLSVTMIVIVAITMIGTSYHASCFIGINRGAGDSRFVAIVDMICGWFIVLPMTLLAVFVFRWSLPMVFLCTRIDQCFKWIIAFIRLRGNKWIKNVTRKEHEVSC